MPAHLTIPRARERETERGSLKYWHPQKTRHARASVRGKKAALYHSLGERKRARKREGERERERGHPQQSGAHNARGGGEIPLRHSPGERKRERERERERDESLQPTRCASKQASKQASKRDEREIQRERERERARMKYCTFAWGPVPLPCIGGELGGLTWTVPPGEPTQFSQRCLSRISDAVLFKAPWVASAGWANSRPASSGHYLQTGDRVTARSPPWPP